MGIRSWWKGEDIVPEVYPLPKDGVKMEPLPPVQAPVGTVFKIVAMPDSPGDLLSLRIVDDVSGETLRSTGTYGDASEMSIRATFLSLVQNYEASLKVFDREGEYDQWPPQ